MKNSSDELIFDGSSFGFCCVRRVLNNLTFSIKKMREVEERGGVGDGEGEGGLGWEFGIRN